MEMIGTLFATAIGSGAAAATGGTVAATAATAATATASASSTALTIIQGVGTAFSALATIGAASASASQLEAAAKEEKFRARDEFIEGEREAAKLRKELALTIGRQKVAFAAGGVDLSSQGVGVAREQAIDDAENELGLAHNTAMRRGLARRRQARGYLARAGSTMVQGFLGAGEQVADFAMDAYARHG